MNMRQKLKLFEDIDNCQGALESYRMMLSDKQDLLMRFDEKDIKHLKNTFDAVDLTEEERMALFTRFAHWRNIHYDTYADTLNNPTIFIDEFVRDCSVALSNLKMAINAINDKTVWPKLLAFLKPKEEKSIDQSSIVPDTVKVLNLLIHRIIEKTPPIYTKIAVLQKFEEISTTKIPVGEIPVEEISIENNNILIEKLSSFRKKEKTALNNLLSTLNTIEEMAIELKDKNAELDKNKFSTWLNTYCNKADEQKDPPKMQGN